jgi:hypothetical protein
MIKNDRTSKQQIRKFINRDLYSNRIIQPEIKMKMVEEFINDKKIQAIRDADEIAKNEKILFEKIRDSDPTLLSEDC